MRMEKFKFTVLTQIISRLSDEDFKVVSLFFESERVRRGEIK